MQQDSRVMDISGYKEKQDNIRELRIIPGLEVVENQYEGENYLVELKTNEVTTICPKTGLPDFAEVTIQYKPAKYLVEQKALKLYLTGYRNVGIFQEHAANKILEDFVACVKPGWARIETVWNSRGGIDVRVEREYGVR